MSKDATFTLKNFIVMRINSIHENKSSKTSKDGPKEVCGNVQATVVKQKKKEQFYL